MFNIPIGAKREERILVTEDVAIDFMGRPDTRVLATPMMIGFMEMAARNLIKEHVGADRDSVGTHVDVKHLASTPVGMQVSFFAEVISVDGQRVRVKVEAFDELEKVGEGEHERFVVDVGRFAERVKSKAANVQRPVQQARVLKET